MKRIMEGFINKVVYCTRGESQWLHFFNDTDLFPGEIIRPRSSMNGSLIMTSKGDNSNTKKPTDTDKSPKETGTFLTIRTTWDFTPVSTVILFSLRCPLVPAYMRNKWINEDTDSE